MILIIPYKCFIFVRYLFDMKIIITENKRIRLAINWLEDEYPDLKKIVFPTHEGVFLSDKGMFKMLYNSRVKGFYVLDLGRNMIMISVLYDLLNDILQIYHHVFQNDMDVATLLF